MILFNVTFSKSQNEYPILHTVHYNVVTPKFTYHLGDWFFCALFLIYFDKKIIYGVISDNM